MHHGNQIKKVNLLDKMLCFHLTVEFNTLVSHHRYPRIRVFLSTVSSPRLGCGSHSLGNTVLELFRVKAQVCYCESQYEPTGFKTQSLKTLQRLWIQRRLSYFH